MTEELRLLQPQVRTELLAALKAPDATGAATAAASGATTAATIEIVLQMRAHEHEPSDDVFCENLLALLGQRAPMVLLCLLEVEEELHQLRLQPARTPRGGPSTASPDPSSDPPASTVPQ